MVRTMIMRTNKCLYLEFSTHGALAPLENVVSKSSDARDWNPFALTEQDKSDLDLISDAERKIKEKDHKSRIEIQYKSFHF